MTDPTMNRPHAPSGTAGRLRSWSPLVVALLLVAPIAGCGKKGDPLPPIRQIPAAARDFQVTQRGDQLLLSVPYPTTTVAGTPLAGVGQVAFWQLLWGAPADGDASARQVDQRQFVSGAQAGLVLGKAEVDEAVVGNRVALAMPVSRFEGEGAEVGEHEQSMLTLAVKTQGPAGEESGFSNLVSLALLPAPAPPTGLSAEGEDRGIRLSWEYPEAVEDAGEEADQEASEGEADAASEASEAAAEEAMAEAAPEDEATEEAPPESAMAGDAPAKDRGILGFNVYRRLATERRYGEPVKEIGRRARTFVDQTAVLGQRYVYTVTAVAERRPVVVESAFGEEVELDYRDRFAPPTPTGVVALFQQTGGENRVRVVWRPVESDDLAGYRIYRRGPESQQFRSLSEDLVTGTELIDVEVSSGATYTYRVTAVDRSGNESEPSAQVSANIR